MPLHHRTIGFSRARTLVLPCFLTLQLTPCAIAHLIPTHSPSSPYSLPFTLPTHIPSLSLCTFHPFVVTTLALSNSIHVFFHGVRETGLFTHGRDTLSSKIISMCTPDVAMPCLCYAWLGCAMPRTCTRLSLSRVFDHYQHLANSVVVVYISFRKFLLSLKT